MKCLATSALFTLLFTTSTSFAGVQLNMVQSDAAGQQTSTTLVYVQDDMIRVDDVDESGSSMIFRDNQMIHVNHQDKNYSVIDEAMLDGVSEQLNSAMAQMEAQLASLPPEQRAMVEQMMKGQMQGMMGQKETIVPVIRVEPIGSGHWESYDCEKFAVYTDEVKTQEVCAAELDSVAGAEEAISALQAMAEFMAKMTESLPMGLGDNINPGELIEQINGLPVHTVDYKDGKIDGQTSMESIEVQSLELSLFEVPEGYTQSN